MVREALSHATPTAIDNGVIELEVSDCEVHLEGLERNRAVITDSIEEIAGLKVTRLEYRPQTTEATESPAPPPSRLDRTTDREDRLKRYRQADPGLDALAEALDLEVLE
jgi:hypothetical protein